MMSYSTFSVETDSDGIALLSIDLPDQSMNVWNEALMGDFSRFVDDFCTNDDIKGLVITSGKKSAFLAGADLRMLSAQAQAAEEIRDNPAKMKEVFEGAFTLNKVLRKLETSGQPAKALVKGTASAKPVAAAVNGLALGGGLELVLACHYRVAAGDAGVKLGVPEVQVGLLPGAGGTQRLPRLAGLQNAAMLATQGKPIDANAAKAQGILQEVVPSAELIDNAKAWVKANAKTAQPWDKKGFKFPGGGGAMDPRSVQFFMAANAMAQRETNHNYPAVEGILSSMYEGSIVPMDTAIKIESKYFTKQLTGTVAPNMIRTLFVNKQAAEKGEGRPEGVPKAKLDKIAVLGAGMMGAGIAYVSAKAGIEVVLLDQTSEQAERGKAVSEKIVAKGVSRGKVTKEKGDALLARITTTTDYNDIKDVDMVIEAVFEDPGIKAKVIAQVDEVIGENTIFASNTSTLPITGLAKHAKNPAQFVGIHFFSPVDKMPLVEIIPGAKTEDLALATALDYVAKIKKTPIVVKDAHGFYTNQVVPPYLNESILMVSEGVGAPLIENAAKALGMPVGPLALTDETSLELGLRLVNSARELAGDKYEPVGVEDLLETMVLKLERKGRKSGGGFYDYPEGGKKALWAGLTEQFPLAAVQPDFDEVKERLLFAQLVPAVKCFADGVVHDPQSADIGAIFGWGFAPWTGGPMSFIDTIGMDAFLQRADQLKNTHGKRFDVGDAFRDFAREHGRMYKIA